MSGASVESVAATNNGVPGMNSRTASTTGFDCFFC